MTWLLQLKAKCLLGEKMTSFLVVVATKMWWKKIREGRLEVAKTGRDFFWSWPRPIWAKKVGRDFLVRCNQGISQWYDTRFFNTVLPVALQRFRTPFANVTQRSNPVHHRSRWLSVFRARDTAPATSASHCHACWRPVSMHDSS